MNRAVFVDRDGTIIAENARTPEAVKPLPGAIKALRDLQDAGYLLFLVSNQPDFSRKAVTFDELQEVHNRFKTLLDRGGVELTEVYYCYHHPDAGCGCRKPEPGFLRRAQLHYKLDPGASWMIGDRETDVECGKRAGTRTIRVTKGSGLPKAAKLILSEEAI